MNKDEVTQYLIEKGYNAVNEGGVIIVYSSDITFDELKKILKEVDYNSSFGLRPKEVKNA